MYVPINNRGVKTRARVLQHCILSWNSYTTLPLLCLEHICPLFYTLLAVNLDVPSPTRWRMQDFEIGDQCSRKFWSSFEMSVWLYITGGGVGGFAPGRWTILKVFSKTFVSWNRFWLIYNKFVSRLSENIRNQFWWWLINSTLANLILVWPQPMGYKIPLKLRKCG